MESANDHRDDEFTPGSWPFYRPPAIAPLCLCAVAALHLARVICCDQTPWKGGGFGMFSTVDDPSARTVRVYLITDDGEFPVEPPQHLHKRISELQAAPSRPQMEQLAERLAKSSWRHRDRYWQSIAAEVAQDDVAAVGRKSDVAPTVPGGAGAPKSVATDITAASGTAAATRLGEAADAARTRGVKSPIEPAPAGRAANSEVRPRAVRVELWRQHFDGATSRLINRQQWRHTYRRTAAPGSA